MNANEKRKKINDLGEYFIFVSDRITFNNFLFVYYYNFFNN